MNKKYYIYISFLLLISGLWGCKGFKTSKAGIFYHNVTAKYNGYFNAREKLKEVETNLYNATEDNFTKLLIVYPVGNESAAKSANSDLETIVKKATRVIKKHDVSKWIDDSYFLIAKAYFYKRDYFAAIETFQFINQKYPKTDPGYASLIWIARSYLELGKLEEAQAQFSVIKGVKTFPDELQPAFDVVQADYFIRTEEYHQAAKHLEKALPGIKEKKYQVRYNFILAQLHSKLGQQAKASEFYNAVIKKNPPYEISFQAKMGLAESFEGQSEKSRKDVKNYLIKLTRDDKNIQYLDQVYYQLAKIEMREGNKAKAIDYLRLSARKSQKNNTQKALSYVMLADIFFQQPDYQLSKAYYDSAARFISEDYADFQQFKKRQTVLSDLIGNLIVIQREDSLQRLGSLSRTELDKFVDNMIQNEKNLTEQQKAMQEQMQQQQDMQINDPLSMANNPIPVSISQNEGGDWYFYNPVTLASGAADFRRRWGNRPLQDDWRRRTKLVGAGITDNPNNAYNTQKGGDNQNINNQRDTTVKTEPPAITGIGDVPAERQKYYSSIPFSPAQKSLSNNKIQEALFRAGTIYYEGLKEYDKAIKTYDELLRRFPDNQHLLKTNYNLYKIYTELKDSVNAEKYRSLILKNYPGSEYAILIENPEQLRQKYANRNKNADLEALYDQAFRNFQENKCSEVVLAYNDASQRFGKNYLKVKFDYLRTLCVIKQDSNIKAIDTLKGFINRYPGDEMAAQAKKLVTYLEEKAKAGQETPKEVDSSELVVKPVPYKRNDSLNHYFLMVIPSTMKVDMNKVKAAFSDYNIENHANENLQVTSLILDGKTQAILVRNFADNKATMKYYNLLVNNKIFIDKLNLPTHTDVVITDENLRILMREKDIKVYNKFFRETYL